MYSYFIIGHEELKKKPRSTLPVAMCPGAVCLLGQVSHQGGGGDLLGRGGRGNSLILRSANPGTFYGWHFSEVLLYW